MMNLLAAFVFLTIVAIIVFFTIFSGSNFIRAKYNGLHITLKHYLDVCMKNAKPKDVIDALILLKTNERSVSLTQLVDHSRKGGNLIAVVTAYVTALRNGKSANFDELSKIQLGGGDPFKAIK